MMKNIEWQVSSLENSKRLKELGLVQKSFWYWVDFHQGYSRKHPRYEESLVWQLRDHKGSLNFDNSISAYTVSELLTAIPPDFDADDCLWDWFKKDRSVDTLSLIIIHLLENKIITVEEVNKRIEGLQ